MSGANSQRVKDVSFLGFRLKLITGLFLDGIKLFDWEFGL